ncbi:unnamed protein product, partial [Phaeothamnion confervicola]
MSPIVKKEEPVVQREARRRHSLPPLELEVGRGRNGNFAKPERGASKNGGDSREASPRAPGSPAKQRGYSQLTQELDALIRRSESDKEAKPAVPATAGVTVAAPATATTAASVKSASGEPAAAKTNAGTSMAGRGAGASAGGSSPGVGHGRATSARAAAASAAAAAAAAAAASADAMLPVSPRGGGGVGRINVGASSTGLPANPSPRATNGPASGLRLRSAVSIQNLEAAATAAAEADGLLRAASSGSGSSGRTGGTRNSGHGGGGGGSSGGSGGGGGGSGSGSIGVAATKKRKASGLRRGKWTSEEEGYANRLIQEFKCGLLPLQDGTTLRTFLSIMLNCDPMRISKKFVGPNCIGKQV